MGVFYLHANEWFAAVVKGSNERDDGYDVFLSSLSRLRFFPSLSYWLHIFMYYSVSVGIQSHLPY